MLLVTVEKPLVSVEMPPVSVEMRFVRQYIAKSTEDLVKPSVDLAMCRGELP
ncbi:MAG TPA: hypothetical protein PKD24_04105 [Pyrinomonadaceae bacterium]|nr:hypothetical protein [Pyrinomonadaceae bacterium]HMP64734.1 hypothetical protein [Pyrinomonadaceae bacterium]